MSTQRLIALGAIMGAHGVRGELRVKSYNEESDLLPGLERVIVQQRSAPGAAPTTRTHAVESVRMGGKGFIFTLSDITTPEQVKALMGAELCIDRAQLPKLAPGEYYFVDLPDMAVVLADGSAVGRVTRVLEYPASNVLCVQTERELLEVPMRAPYLVSVDVAAGHVVVDHLRDLTEHVDNDESQG